MKILHVAQIHWYNAEVQYAYDLADRMRARGHEVHILTRTGSLAARIARERGFKLFEEEGFNAKGLGMIQVFPAAARLRKQLERQRYDMVMVYRSEGLPLIAGACHKVGVPVIRVRGDMRPVRSDPVNRCVYQHLMDGVVVSNTTIERNLRERMGAFQRLTTIHGGVDEQTFHPEGPVRELRAELGFAPNLFLAGVLGRYGPVKGHDVFLDAAERALERGARAGFVILVKSTTAFPDHLRERIERSEPLSESVRVIGHCEDLPATLRAFDLGVISSVGSEANCRVGLEWMGCGTPLLASRIGVLPDIVVEGQTGMLVAPRDAGAMAEKLVYLAGDPGRAAAMGDAARRRVLERFTLDHCASAHEKFIQTVMERE